MTVLVEGSTIVLTGTVDDGSWFWGDGFSAPDVIRALAEIGSDQDVTIRINSGGGIATEGGAIHAALKRHKGRKTIVVEGIAASAASTIVMAGDERIMTPGSVMMIHDPANITLGTIADHQRTIDELTAIAGSMAGVYAAASGQSVEQARADMLAETWLTPEEAVSRGYADRVEGSPAEANDNDVVVELRPAEPAAFAYAQYRHPPERIAALAQARGWNKARSTASAVHRQTEVPMPTTTTTAGDQTPPEGANVTTNSVDIDAARMEGRTAAQANAVEIIDICTLAGAPQKATAFIRDGKTGADVSKALLAERAAGDAPIDSTIPAATAQAGGVDLVADMRRRAGQA